MQHPALHGLALNGDYPAKWRDVDPVMAVEILSDEVSRLRDENVRLLTLLAAIRAPGERNTFRVFDFEGYPNVLVRFGSDAEPVSFTFLGKDKP